MSFDQYPNESDFAQMCDEMKRIQTELAAAMQLQSELQSALQWAKEEIAAVTAERDALKADLCAFAVDMEKQLSASQQREAGRAENDALLTALRALACAAEAYAADQTRATDERCGLVQPITVEEGSALLAALNTANTFLKYDH